MLQSVESAPVIAGSLDVCALPPLPAARPRAVGRGPGPYSVLGAASHQSLDRQPAGARIPVPVGADRPHGRLQAASRCVGGLFVEPVCEASEIAAFATWTRLARGGVQALEALGPYGPVSETLPDRVQRAERQSMLVASCQPPLKSGFGGAFDEQSRPCLDILPVWSSRWCCCWPSCCRRPATFPTARLRGACPRHHGADGGVC